MEYLIEKSVVAGFAFHPLYSFHKWEKKGASYFKDNAVLELKKLAEIENGNYRIRNLYSGKVLFEFSN